MSIFSRNKGSFKTQLQRINNMEYKFSCEEFSEMMLKNLLSKIINNSIAPIELNNIKDESLLNIGASFFEDDKEMEQNYILDCSDTLNEIVLKSMYSRVNIFKVEISGINYFFTDLSYDKKRKTVLINNHNYPVLKAYRVSKPLHNKELLLSPFKLLYNYFVQIDIYSKRSGQFLFKKADFNKNLDSVELAKREEILESAVEDLKNFANGQGHFIVDSKDSFENMKMELGGLTEAMDFAYTEIARIFSIDKATLLGETPTGLGSEGVVEFQKINYERTLKDYRKRLIEPILKGLEIDYKVAGFSSEEKLEILKDFSTYSPSLQVASEELAIFAENLVKEIIDYEN